MELSVKELEDRLKEVGNKLASPPSDVDELLRLLDRTEFFLLRVEQSPSSSMSSALRPVLNALVTKDFLNHPDTNVKAYVAACISEITRITAPDAPYDDELMKEVFAVIVDVFGKFDDILGRSYCKRVSILETVAKVRSCVVMLDLECDYLILQMFKHFLKTIRPCHTMNIFSAMVTIMTLVLEESEDISQELVLCLLSNLQKSNKVVLPVARRLAGEVVSKCAMKLKPYILAAVQSIGTFFSDYGDIVASICQKNRGAPGQNEDSEKPDKVGTCLEEVENSAGKSRKELDNGGITLGNGNPAVEPLSKHEPEHSRFTEQDKIDVSTRGDKADLSSIIVKAANKQEFEHEAAKSWKLLSSVQSTDASDSSWVDGEKEASEPPSRKAGRRKESKHLKVDASDKVKETENSLESRRDNVPQSPEGLIVENSCVNPTSPRDTPHSSGRPKRGRPPKVQMSSKKGKVGKPASVTGKQDHGTVSNLEEKPSSGSGEKSPAVTSDMKPRRNVRKESGKKVSETDSSGKQRKFAIKMPKVSVDPTTGESNLKDKVASYMASNAANDDQNDSKKILNKDSRKKHQRAKELSSDSQHDESKQNEVIVGSKIEVWWPDDKQFYEGMVDSFDPKTKMHKVVYDDGDVEILTLENEQWKYVDEKQGVEEKDIASPEVSLEPPLKKRRASSGSSAKQGRRTSNFESVSKSGGRSRGRPAHSEGSKSPAKAKGRQRHETSRPGTSGEETDKTSGNDEGNKAESFHKNNSNKPPEDSNIVNATTSSGSTSRGRPKSTVKPKGRRRSRSSETPKIKVIKTESSQKSIPDIDILSGDGISKSRKKQEDDSDVKNPDGSSSRSAVKTGKKRRRK